MKFEVGDRVSPKWDDQLYGTVTGSRRIGDNELAAVKWDGASKIVFYHCKDLCRVAPEASAPINYDIPLERLFTPGHLDAGCLPYVDTDREDPKPTKTLLKVGDKVKLPLGGTGVITEVDEYSRVGYPYRVLFDNSNWLWCKHDEVELAPVESQKVLNFWEAREAALSGKKVKKVDTDTEFTIDDFKSDDYSFDNYEIKADWEIVEEPKNKTYIVTIYKNYLAEPGGGLVDCRKNGPPLNQIAITVDENGKFIKGENV